MMIKMKHKLHKLHIHHKLHIQHKLNAQKTFMLSYMNILCTFDLGRISAG